VVARLLRRHPSRPACASSPIFLRHGIHPNLLLGEGLNARNVPYLKYTLLPPTGNENTPGRLTWGNVRYRLRLAWRKAMLQFLK
jgi:hypothetical protein